LDCKRLACVGGCRLEIEIMNETNEKSEPNGKNEPPGKLFLFVVLVFGLGATWASAQWLNGGSITIRSGEAQGARPDSGQVVGQITAEQALFYPLCIAWGLLGVTMIALAGLAFVRKSPLLGKFSAYACAGLLLLVFTTLLATWLLKP
jgi:hypothetical protein